MPIPSSLRQLHDQRLAWAIDGYRSFLEEMDPDVRTLMAGGDTNSSNAVVYGPTQVGKTTLILRLLGITEADDRPISRVLRGGSALGNSATALPTAYHVVDDNKWQITGLDGGLRRLTSREATEHLGRARTSVVTGTASSARPLRIGIPHAIARPDASDALLTTIFDLPGVDARSAAERDYVERIAPALIYNADLVLLVGRADELGFAVPTKLAIEPLRDWILAPERFRLVLTHACKPGTAQEAIKGSVRFDLAAARRYFSTEMMTHDYPPAVRNLEHKIYPLDFGQSLQSIQTDAVLYDAALRINEESIALLRQDIRANVTIEQRLRLASRSHEIATRIQREREKEFNASIASARTDVNSRRQKLDDSRKSLSAAQAEARTAQRRYDELSVLREVVVDGISISAPQLGALGKQSRTRVHARVDEVEREIVDSAAIAWADIIQRAEALSPRLSGRSRTSDTKVRKICRDLLNPTREMLDERERTWRHPFAGEEAHSRKACWEELEEQSGKAARDVEKYLRAQAKRLLAPIDQTLGKRNDAAQRRLSQAEKSVEARRKRLAATEEYVKEVRRDRSLFDKRMRQTVAYAKRYDEHMNSAYRTELARRHRELRESPTESRLVSALYLLSTAETAHRLEVTQ